MTITFETLEKPEGRYRLKDEQLFNETRRAEDILKTMHEETYEELVTAWAFWCLKENGKSKYEDVLTCMFKNIGAEEFLKLFIAYHNSRKRDYWNFFDRRYDSRDCFDLDREFIDNLRGVLEDYLSDDSVVASGTKKYCSKMLELLDKKVQQFGEH